MIDKNFMGLDGMVWFIGIVEDRQDPLGLGRVRVRCFGWHTDSLTDIPTNQLPWAQVLQPGTDRNFATPREDDQVLGFFADGRDAQIPIVLGILNGVFSQVFNPNKGFNDQRSANTLQQSPKILANAVYNTNGAGITLKEKDVSDNIQLATIRHPTPDEANNATLSGVVLYENLANTVIVRRQNNVDKDVVTAAGVQWSEPYPAYNPAYPYNQAYVTESGHVIEFDDTPGAERIALQHRSGSFIEMYPTGTVVAKATKSRYQVVMGEDHCHVMGRSMVTIDSDCLLRIQGNLMLEVDQSTGLNIAGSLNVSVGQALNFKAQSVNFDVEEDTTISSGTFHATSTDGDIDIKAQGNLNSQAEGQVSTISGGQLNQQAGGDYNFLGSGNFLVNAPLASFDGGIVEGNYFSTNGTTPVSGQPNNAEAGDPAGISAAPGLGTPTTGRPTPEQTPIPRIENFTMLTPETGTAYTQSLFLDQSANGQYIDPGANSANVAAAQTAANVGPCNFDPNKCTFIQDPSTWALSDNGTNLIQQFESFAKTISPDTATAYPDPATGGQPYTIGYGSTAAAIDQPVTLGEIISRETAQSYLTYAVNKKFLPTLQQTITVPLTQNMIDACLSLIYNIGPTNFQNSTLAQKINASAWCDAGNQFLVWNKAKGTVLPGLTTRRTAERSLFLTQG